ncbi:11289_t:CDS:2 [Paraglomus occultum]|uniref:11289_t:CDS:1 n=1 Tax=Paraglomus occultum TaxID=144539 RepID=A0A9N9AJW6_9GLOM|nr:11289_t:CDS:2 [Paraglomus occultum]
MCPERGVTAIDSISLASELPFFDTIPVNILVQPGKCITYKFHPSTPPPISPSYVFQVRGQGVNGPIFAASATFTIGNPGFGLIITKPVTDTNAHCGGKLKIRWKDPFKLYDGLTFTEFTLVEAGVRFIPFSPPPVNVPVSAGEKTVRIPLGLKNEHSYHVEVRLVRNNNHEVYASDEFRISRC